MSPNANKLSRCLAEVEREIKKAARAIPKSKAVERKHFMKAVMPMHGLTVPQQRSILRRGFIFSSLPPGEQFPIWKHIWFEAKSHETKMQAIFYINGNADDFEPTKLWRGLKSWAGDINCWDQADELAKRFSFLYEAKPALVYPTLNKWNADRDPWKRRLSIVSLYCYARLHDRHPPLRHVLPLVESLIGDNDRYVQKGVGWTLREAHSVSPNQVYDFIARHATDLHSAAFSTATEKITAKRKQRLKLLRREAKGKI